jgi:hypothetical protein
MRLEADFPAQESSEQWALPEQFVAVAYFSSVVFTTISWIYVLSRGVILAMRWIIS